MENRERFYNVPPARAEGVVDDRREGGIAIEKVDERTAMVPRDRVRWGPVWAGLLTTFSLFLLLELMAYAFGWLTLGTGAAGFPQAAGRGDAWVTGIIGLISFFVGGLVAGTTAWVRGAGAGLINGFCLWALATVLILLLSAIGLGTFFGTAGNAFNQFISWGRGINFSALGVNPDQLGATVRDGALWAFVLMLLSAGAAMLGGWIGSQGDPIGRIRRTDRVER